ncbi:MAG: M24 family metallopeptidase [Candidatus Aenigmarchaeota archaeon]|nr:M24 family metallopeptidase [Candidatus Aenigmarchaeota archaeon]MDW8149478.1 M24 family metallopeptidase [Candidatus Aenigmarchaeota archaeon]
MIKNKKEIEFIKKSAKIASSCIPLIKKLLKKKKITEREIALAIRRKIYSQGAKLAFNTIVACGKRSAMIHPKPRVTNRLVSGLGYVDFGASYKGYKTDMTIPFIKGNISKKEEKIVYTVVKAYELAIKSIKINLPCFKLFEKVNNFLRKHGFYLQHSLGHGVGMKIHELPIIGTPKRKFSKKRKIIKFQKNMVFTIEPAIYVKELGGCRLENTFLLTDKGLISLTKARLIKV